VENVPYDHKIYQNNIKYTKVPRNIPKWHKIFQSDIRYTKVVISHTKLLGKWTIRP
jgi:hypothetical protein